MKPNLYIDVDGVMLLFPASNKHEPTVNNWLLDFILNNKDRFDKIYWLSCWTAHANPQQLYFEYPIFKELNAIPLYWRFLKTDAIDWTKPFIWLEDGMIESERAIFNEKGKYGQQVWEIRNKWETL